MRGFITGLLSIVLASVMGCGEPRTAQREPIAPSGGVSMRPLTPPQPAPPMQGYSNPASPVQEPDPYASSTAYAPPPSPYARLSASAPVSSQPAAYTPPPAEPVYSGAEIYTVPDFSGVSPAYTSSSGQYCEVTDTLESSYMVPMVDPPILVDGRTTAYYPPQAQPPATPAAPVYAPAISAPVYAPAVAEPAFLAPTPAPATTVAASFPPPLAIPGQLQLVAALDIPPGSHPNDYGPSQWFEIIRPDNGPIRIGRVSSTCVCVGVRVPNRHVAAGQRALVEARLVARPPQANVTYGLYVQVLEPVNMMLDADVSVSARR